MFHEGKGSNTSITVGIRRKQGLCCRVGWFSFEVPLKANQIGAQPKHQQQEHKMDLGFLLAPPRGSNSIDFGPSNNLVLRPQPPPGVQWRGRVFH